MGLETGTFGFGGVVYPLTESTTNSLLADADPALAIAADYLAECIHIFAGDRLRTQAQAESKVFGRAVEQIVHVEPTPFLLSGEFKFPLFALHRTEEVFANHTSGWEKGVAQWTFSYVLPPLNPRQIKQLQPILRSVVVILKEAITRGSFPQYRDGLEVWKAAGIMSARLVNAKYGAFESIVDANQFYRAVVGTIEVVERDMAVDGAFPLFTGASIVVSPTDAEGNTVPGFLELNAELPPELISLDVTTGSKAGGTVVPVRGTGFRGDVRVLFGNAESPSVTVVSPTELTCVTPSYAAYPTALASVVVVNGDGQSSNRLNSAFAFTTP